MEGWLNSQRGNPSLRCPSLLLLCLSSSLFSSSHGIATSAGLEDSLTVDPAIVATRLRIYDQVIQALAIQAARGQPQDHVVTVPPLPFGDKSLQEVVILDVHTLQLQGYTFHEFYLPPGVRVPTTEPQIILSYQSKFLSNAPVNPPLGYFVVAPVVTLMAFPISALADAAARPIVLLSPQGTPITVTFINAVPNAYCATFNNSGGLLLVPTQHAPAKTVCSATSIGTFTLTRLPPPPPGVPPVPAPALAPGPAVAPSVFPPPTTAPEPSPAPGTSPPAVHLPPPPTALQPPPGPSSNTGLIVGLCVGLGLPLLILAAVGIWYASRAIARGRLEGMEKESDKRASLETAIVGGSRAPAAGALRTRPYLESEDLTSDRM